MPANSSGEADTRQALIGLDHDSVRLPCADLVEHGSSDRSGLRGPLFFRARRILHRTVLHIIGLQVDEGSGRAIGLTMGQIAVRFARWSTRPVDDTQGKGHT